MPYGDLVRQAVQRFEKYEDLDANDCTIEEREEYEPHLAEGNLVFAGIDYGAILERAQEEADVILWDGGNNDTPFIHPDVHIVVVDPHRAGHERRYHPGETNLRMADVCVINKLDTAPAEGVEAVLASIAELNPNAEIVRANSPFTVEGDAGEIRGQARARGRGRPDADARGHGVRRRGLGRPANGAASLVDPRPYAVGSIRETYAKYPHMTELLPAMGYGDKQTAELRRDDQRLGRGRRPHRNADRPAADRGDRQAGDAGHVQAGGDRRADDREHPQGAAGSSDGAGSAFSAPELKRMRPKPNVRRRRLVE